MERFTPIFTYDEHSHTHTHAYTHARTRCKQKIDLLLDIFRPCSNSRVCSVGILFAVSNATFSGITGRCCLSMSLSPGTATHSAARCPQPACTGFLHGSTKLAPPHQYAVDSSNSIIKYIALIHTRAHSLFKWIPSGRR